jgi:hypothetical protein
MEIDKDKVVDLAKALLAAHKVGEIDSPVYYQGIWKGLEEALNPPPARPTKEECVKWVKKYLLSSIANNLVPEFAATIEYLEEPSLQRVKNTGVMPICKKVIAEYRDGDVLVDDPMAFGWIIENLDTDIIEYIILE